MDRITQIIVPEENFAEMQKYLESKNNEFLLVVWKQFEAACDSEVDYIRSPLAVGYYKFQVEGKVIFEIVANGLTTLEGRIKFNLDMTSYMPELEKLGAEPYSSHNRQND